MAGKSMYQMKDKTEYFPTPAWVKDELYKFIPAGSVLVDPCCGAGELEENDKGVKVYCQDLVKRTDKYDVELRNFLEDGLGSVEGKAFDGFLMNPPFKLAKQFIEKAFEYSDDVYLIAPLRGVFRNFGECIVEYSGSWKMTRDFNILVSVACFHLHKSKGFHFGGKPNLKTIEDRFLLPRLPRDKMMDSIFKPITADKLEYDKPFICLRITKARIVRGEELIKDEDIFEAGDDTAFIAQTANINVKRGDKIGRNVMFFDTMEEAEDFQKLVNDDADYIRQYCYEYGNGVLYPKYIPLPQKLQ